MEKIIRIERQWKSLVTARDLKASVFATPTDTIYGLSATLSNRAGTERMKQLKGRPNESFILLVSSIQQAEAWTQTHKWEKILRSSWPGPITFVLPTLDGKSTLALRIPNHPFLLSLIAYVGEPIFSTSANHHGLPPAESVQVAISTFGSSVDFYFDGGSAIDLIPTTLVDLSGETPRILRQGSAPFQVAEPFLPK